MVLQQNSLLPKKILNNFLFPDPDFDDAQSPDFDDAQSPDFDDAQSPDFDDAQSPDFDDAQSPWEENLKEKFLPQP